MNKIRGRPPGVPKIKLNFYLTEALFDKMWAVLKMNDPLHQLVHKKSRARYGAVSRYIEYLVEADLRRRELLSIKDPAARITQQELNALDDIAKT